MPLRVVPVRDRKLHRLVKRAEIRTLDRGELLYQTGDQAESVFLVRKGHLRLDHARGDDAPRTVAVVGPWELAGEEGLVEGQKRRTDARAGEGAQLQELPGMPVVRALRTAEKTLDAFLTAKAQEEDLARILSGTRRKGGVSQRLGSVLLDLSRRMGRTEGKGVRIPISLTHQLLADLSGAHRSTVTTLLNDWIYEGLLRDGDKGLVLLDPGGLESRVGARPSVDPKSP